MAWICLDGRIFLFHGFWMDCRNIERREIMPINSSELTRMVLDTLSDGYDDEENREEAETALYNELSQLS